MLHTGIFLEKIKRHAQRKIRRGFQKTSLSPLLLQKPGEAPGFCVPSPWIGRFDSESDFLRAREQLPKLFDVFSSIDDHLLNSRHPQNFPTLCLVCGSVETTLVNWSFVGVSPEGSINPAWTETSTCSKCGLNSRMRALLAFILQHPDYTPSARCYLAERTTISWPEFSRRFAELESSEFLGPDHQPGEKIFVPKVDALVQHEDLTRLSFTDASFDWVVTQDVFEHIPDYPAAFQECARVLAPGGNLVFSVPFFCGSGLTRVRARIDTKGEVEHLLPPEIHGNPVNNEGSLCFQNFGWDILDTLRASGFSKASAHLYWAPWLGHLGLTGFVFSAQKSASAQGQ